MQRFVNDEKIFIVLNETLIQTILLSYRFSLFFLFFFVLRSIETKGENPLAQYFEADVANKDRERKKKDSYFSLSLDTIYASCRHLSI